MVWTGSEAYDRCLCSMYSAASIEKATGNDGYIDRAYTAWPVFSLSIWPKLNKTRL